MGQYRMPGGREVYLTRVAIASTYEGLLEGSPEAASPRIVERLPERAARMLPHSEPLVVVPPPRMPLPEWLVVAELGSRRGARQSDPDYSSRLSVCWFVEGTSRSIDDMVREVLPGLDWDREAEDFDIMDF